eukprot:7946799-Heterocapsa_arctica.AAC.1
MPILLSVLALARAQQVRNPPRTVVFLRTMEKWMEATSAAKRITHPASDRVNGASEQPRLRAPPRRDLVNNELLTAVAK